MKFGLSLGVAQQLKLTPALQQALGLLQLSAQELGMEVQAQLQTNPLLELADEALEQTFEEARLSYRTTQSLKTWQTDEDNDRMASLPQERSLADHLHLQIDLSPYSATQAIAAHTVVDCLDDDGYWRDEQAYDPTYAQGLALVQSLDPCGVGARTVAECLQMQLCAGIDAINKCEEGHAEDNHTDLAIWVCKEPKGLDLLARRDYHKLHEILSAQLRAGAPALTQNMLIKYGNKRMNEKQWQTVLQRIQKLEPQPGRAFARTQWFSMTPDLVVLKKASGWYVELNSHAAPQLQLHTAYAAAVKAGDTLHETLIAAKQFLRAVHQRGLTVLRVGQAIMKQQHAFLEKGPQAMRPMVLRDVAQELEMHESTVSRATAGKYISTPRGTFELKYFFSSGLQTKAGEATSSSAVKNMIQQWVKQESSSKPLSDQKMADMLSSQGIACARRTVAKYREALKIAPAQLRKK